MTYGKLNIEKWHTICSDLKELYFFSLVDTGSLIFTIRDSTHKYEFFFEKFGPYMVVDEALRSDDLKVTDPVGWTFIIKDSDIIPLFNPGAINVFCPSETLTHYVIGTYDSGLEILADKEPVIRKYLIEKE
ncbi:MAG: hypothetical protein H0W84_13345 [Bacteroidetes bacterium]|nr:hypothetical protein [Bacteroidota bacterium]